MDSQNDDNGNDDYCDIQKIPQELGKGHEQQSLTDADLLSFCYQIACGMVSMWVGDRCEHVANIYHKTDIHTISITSFHRNTWPHSTSFTETWLVGMSLLTTTNFLRYQILD